MQVSAEIPTSLMLSINIGRGYLALDLFDSAEGVPIDLNEAGVDLTASLPEQVLAALKVAKEW